MSISYPHTAGAKVPGTSTEAAQSTDAPRLRTLVVTTLDVFGPMTADEVAFYCAMSPFSIRPRLTELKRLGKIEATGERRINNSGKSAQVWRLK